MEIARFLYNGKIYIYILKDNKINYAKLDKNHLIEIDNEEKQIMDSLLKYAVISKEEKNHIFIINIDGYDLYLDRNSGFKFLKKDGKIANEEKLNEFLFNLNSNDISCISKKQIQKYKKVKNQYIILTLSLGIVLGLTIAKRIEDETFNEYKNEALYSFNELDTGEYSNIINSNKNLTVDQKELYMKLLDTIINDCGKYINENWVKYTNSKMRYSTVTSQNAAGTWYVRNLVIANGVANNTKDYNHIMTHELLHTMCIPCISNEGYRLHEGMTELLTCEFMNEDIESYPDLVAINKTLIEIIGKEKMIECYFKGDVETIETELSGIIDDVDMSKRFMTLCDIDYECTLNQNVELQKKTNTEIYNLLCAYYQAKFDKPMKDDMLISTYFKNVDINTKPIPMLVKDSRLLATIDYIKQNYYSKEINDNQNTVAVTFYFYDSNNLPQTFNHTIKLDNSKSINNILEEEYNKVLLEKISKEEKENITNNAYNILNDFLNDNYYLISEDRKKQILDILTNAKNNADLYSNYSMYLFNNIAKNNDDNGKSITKGMSYVLDYEYARLKAYDTTNYLGLVTKSLIELVGKDTMMNYYLTGDISIVKTALLNITNDENLINELIDNCDELLKHNYSRDKDLESKISNTIIELNDKKNSINDTHNTLVNYYMDENFRNIKMPTQNNDSKILNVYGIEKFYYNKIGINKVGEEGSIAVMLTDKEYTNSAVRPKTEYIKYSGYYNANQIFDEYNALSINQKNNVQHKN